MTEKRSTPPAVDPSPTAEPIYTDERSVAEILEASGVVTPASDPEVLALKPSRVEDAVSGPHPQVSQTTYVHMTKPDGTDFLAPLANVEGYEALGYKKGKTEEIEDIGAYWAAKAAQPPAAPAEPST